MVIQSYSTLCSGAWRWRDLKQWSIKILLSLTFFSGLFNAFDENKDGHIDFKEISCGVSACCRGPLTERQKCENIAYFFFLWNSSIQTFLIYMQKDTSSISPQYRLRNSSVVFKKNFTSISTKLDQAAYLQWWLLLKQKAAKQWKVLIVDIRLTKLPLYKSVFSFTVICL